MKYLEVLCWWCGVNFYMWIVVYLTNFPLIDFMIYFFGGFFLIIVFWYIDLLIKNPLNYGVLSDILKQKEDDKT